MQKNIMNQFYTAESVTEGHPDKLCDLIADSVLDECLSHDALSRVACEVLATKGQIIVAGEITSLFEPDITQIAHSVLRKVGYDPTRFAVQCLIHKQSPDIAAGVDCSLERRRNLGENHSAVLLGAGDQGVMVGYACSETPQMMPLPVVLAHRLTGTLTFARKSGMIQGLRPDGKAQVTVEYDEDGKPLRLDTIVLSAQHSPKKPIDELYVLGDTLAYAVDTITVTDPADIEAIEIRQDKDLVTLVTCTPYSVNTHRLLVRGHRIELTEEEITEETKATEPEASTWMEKYIEGIFFGFIIGGAVLVLVRALSKKVRENQ